MADGRRLDVTQRGWTSSLEDDGPPVRGTGRQEWPGAFEHAGAREEAPGPAFGGRSGVPCGTAVPGDPAPRCVAARTGPSVATSGSIHRPGPLALSARRPVASHSRRPSGCRTPGRRALGLVTMSFQPPRGSRSGSSVRSTSRGVDCSRRGVGRAPDDPRGGDGRSRRGTRRRLGRTDPRARVRRLRVDRPAPAATRRSGAVEAARQQHEVASGELEWLRRRAEEAQRAVTRAEHEEQAAAARVAKAEEALRRASEP
jgi:hypothetical protein